MYSTDDEKRADKVKQRLMKRVSNPSSESAFQPNKETYNLFKDKDLQSYINKLSPKTREKLAVMGKQYYDQMNYKEEKKEISFDMKQPEKPDDQIKESLAYIISSLRSGLHPSQLNQQERDFLDQYYKSDWRQEFGFDS